MAAGSSPPFLALAQHVHGASVPLQQSLHTPTWRYQVFIQVAAADSPCMEDFHRRTIFCLQAFTCTSYQILKRNILKRKDHVNKQKCYLSALASSSLSLIKLHERHFYIAKVYHLHSIIFVLQINKDQLSLAAALKYWQWC